VQLPFAMSRSGFAFAAAIDFSSRAAQRSGFSRGLDTTSRRHCDRGASTPAKR
jgi:hypothetical protein